MPVRPESEADGGLGCGHEHLSWRTQADPRVPRSADRDLCWGAAPHQPRRLHQRFRKHVSSEAPPPVKRNKLRVLTPEISRTAPSHMLSLTPLGSSRSEPPAYRAQREWRSPQH